jgi:hypothetical protein
MQHPFQLIATISPRDATGKAGGHVLAACGPTLYCVNLDDNTVSSQWSVRSDAVSSSYPETNQLSLMVSRQGLILSKLGRLTTYIDSRIIRHSRIG